MKNGPLKYWLKKIFYHPVMRAKRFLDYAPILWQDEDYDWSAILRMLQYKIKRTRLHLEDHKMFEGFEEACAEMLEAETIIDRILKESWLEEEFEAHMKKYPLQWKTNEKGEEYLESTHDKPQGVEFKSLHERRRALEEADWNRLGFLISTHLRGWWD